MKKLLSLIAAFGVMFALTSCGDDDDDTVNLAAPVVTAPAASSVQVGNSVTVSFPYTAAAGFASSSVSVTGGTATITTDGTANATSGTIEVSFTAGTIAGAGSVTLTVIDGENDEANATAVLTISMSAVPTIAGIPATESIEAGQTLTVNNIVLTAEDGFDTFSAQVTGGDELFSNDISGEGSPFTTMFSLPIDIATPAGAIEVVFTLTDSDGDAATFTHVLTVTLPQFETVVVDANITTNTNWTADKIYELATRVIVEPGAILTIDAGTVIKGQEGSGAAATALVIARGAQIEAVGSASAPIIFTSTADDIFPGLIASPNLDETDRGLWGGLVVLGDAPISDEGNDGTEQIEGIPGDVALAQYGGSNAMDDSGTLRYVSIRHGGSKLGDGDEINGLTLGGVGNGTEIAWVEVVANLDDGVEWFGGTVDVSNVLVWSADDDAIDIDQAYSGTIDNAIVIANGTDHCLEIDGPEGNATGAFTLTNVSAKGEDQELADFRDIATGSLDGAYFFNFPSPTEDVNGAEEGGTGEGDFSLSSGTTTSTMTFANIQITLDTDPATTLAEVFKDFSAAEVSSIVSEVALGSQTQGADKTEFMSWTFADATGQLADF